MKKTYTIFLFVLIFTTYLHGQCESLGDCDPDTTDSEIYLCSFIIDPINPTFEQYKCAMAAASGKTLVIPTGTWKVPLPPGHDDSDPNHFDNIALVPDADTDIRFEQGAVLLQEPTLFNKLRLIAIVNENVHIYGHGTIRGDLDHHKAIIPCSTPCGNSTPPYEVNQTCTTKTGEGTYLIWVDNPAENWSIKDVTLTHSWGDGIHVGGSKYIRATINPNLPVIGGLIENVKCDDNRRNGMSVTWSEGLTIRNCAFRKTGHTAKENGLRRRLPTTGIDVETDYWGRVTGLVLENCLSEDNIGAGFAFQSPHRNEEGLIPMRSDAKAVNCIARLNGDPEEGNPHYYQSPCNAPFPGIKIVGYMDVTLQNVVSELNAGHGIFLQGDKGHEVIYKHTIGGTTVKAPRIGQAKVVINGGHIRENAKHGLLLDNKINPLVVGTPDESIAQIGGQNEIYNVDFKNNGTLLLNNYDNIHIGYGEKNKIEENTTSALCDSSISAITRHNIYIDSVAELTRVRGNKFHASTVSDECSNLATSTIWFNNPLNAINYNVCEYKIVSNGAGAGTVIQLFENISEVTTVQATEIPLITTYSIDYTNTYGLSEYHANLFVIDPISGDLRFNTAPDYEAPLTTRTWIDPSTGEIFQEYVVDVYATTPCEFFTDWQRIFVRVKNDVLARQANTSSDIDIPFISNEITVSPNPFKEQILIRSSEALKNITVYTIEGKQIHSFDSKSKELYESNLNMVNFSKGLYFIKITTSKGITTKKMLRH